MVSCKKELQVERKEKKELEKQVKSMEVGSEKHVQALVDKRVKVEESELKSFYLNKTEKEVAKKTEYLRHEKQSMEREKQELQGQVVSEQLRCENLKGDMEKERNHHRKEVVKLKRDHDREMTRKIDLVEKMQTD